MGKNLPHIEQINTLSTAYGSAGLAELLGITERAMQIWLADHTRKPRAETLRKLGELFARHQNGENIAMPVDATDYKDKYIASLEKQNRILEDQLNSATGELRHIAVMNFAMLKVMRKTAAQILAKVEKGDLQKIAEVIDTETAAYYRSVREKGSLIDVGI